MSDYQNSGIISVNRRKRPGKKDPDIAGALDDVVCPHCNRAASYRLNGWFRESDKGKFYGLSVRPKDAAKTRGADMPPPVQDDSDIPF
jgi:hypothetical protein